MNHLEIVDCLGHGPYQDRFQILQAPEKII